MNAKILEVFRSIQGEGKYAGSPQVFVRFFECNMHCVWCDTPGSIGDTARDYKEVSLEDLLVQVKALHKGCHSVSITGGEPLLQVEFLTSFLPSLRREGMRIYLETNGVLPKELSRVIDDVDIVAMDMKLPSSTKERAFWSEHEEFLAIALKKDVFIKAVVSKDTADEDIHKAVDIVTKINPGILFILQPNYLEMKAGAVKRSEALLEYCSKYLHDVRILPQMHKYMKMR